MKKTLLAAFITATSVFSTNTTAQDKKVEIGVKAGANLSEFGGDANYFSSKIGFHVGVTFDYEFSASTYLMTGLNLTAKGAKLKDVSIMGIHGVEEDEIDLTYNPMYLELPIHVGYKLGIADDVKLAFHGGPYLAYGIAGKHSSQNSSWSEDTDNNMFQAGLLKRFDFGIGLGIGVEYKKCVFNITYDLGLANIKDIENQKLTNRNFSAGLGYKF